MKIYFAGSIRGGRSDAFLYSKLIEFLRGYGEVMTEHIGDPFLSYLGDDGGSDRFIHDRDVVWLLASDVLVAEVTVVSLGVGYEIGRAVAAGKPVICLYRHVHDKKLSAMIAGCPELILIRYENVEEAKEKLSLTLTELLKH
jgi:2'-deoxynucleoside 5'-phosphate N-hydrolase